MAKRLFDIVFSTVLLLCTSPLFLVAAIGIVVSDRGPVFFRARRSGVKGREFSMMKFRTMRMRQPQGASAITAHRDARIFPFGAFLRASKIDELPQFLNVLAGDMSVVGPRPEDPAIVDAHFGERGRETLTVRPGVASPGSIFNYTDGERMLQGGDTEQVYAQQLLPVKLALELVYVRNASFFYDLRIIARTVLVIAAMLAGKRRFAPPPEMAVARRLGLVP
ncbi:MAG: sugar transferase [Ignavibacteria bacterium]|nr:sugar transferase [Ignavibacteria bacterium]